jgi:hypothetical protein
VARCCGRSTRTLDAMGRVESAVIAVAVAGSAAADAYFVSSRCSLSPPVAWSVTLFGILFQLAAASFPILVGRCLSGQLAGYRLKVSSLALLLVLISLPLLQYGVMYGDALGKDKMYRSVGMRCGAPLV